VSVFELLEPAGKPPVDVFSKRAFTGVRAMITAGGNAASRGDHGHGCQPRRDLLLTSPL